MSEIRLNRLKGSSPMFTRILVPLDGSPESNVALPLADAVAHATDGTIVLLRVITDQDWTAELEAETRAKLSRVAASRSFVHARLRPKDRAASLVGNRRCYYQQHVSRLPSV
jgi:nucleotide-binding universal stress UspA family protein